MLSDKTKNFLKWTLPPIIAAILGMTGIEIFADKLHEMAKSPQENELINIYATQFKFIAGIGLGFFTLAIEYMVYKFRSKNT